MRAAWYDKQGPAGDVLAIGEMPDPLPGAGEVRIRISASGINPADLKKRADAFATGMLYARVIPHSDGAGVIDRIGHGVPAERLGQRVWCFGAQSTGPFGTAAQFTVVPDAQAVPLPEGVDFAAGACLGIPAVTAHRSVHAGGPVDGRYVLVQGGAGGVGVFAAGFARRAGAQVIATVLSASDEEWARKAGAHHIVRVDSGTPSDTIAQILSIAPAGVHHIVDVAFDANIALDTAVLAPGGSIAAYAAGTARPAIPFWELLFKNARILLLNSEALTLADKLSAAREANAMLTEGWSAIRIAQTFPLEQVASAHRYAEDHRGGRIVLLS